MASVNVEIIDPSASKVLEDMEQKGMIKLEKSSADDFIDFVNSIRNKADNPPTMEEITEIVKEVRAEIYAERKSKGNY